MAHFEFKSRGNEFPAIPETGGWFNGGKVNECSNDKYGPAGNNVDKPVIFHKESFMIVYHSPGMPEIGQPAS